MTIEIRNNKILTQGGKVRQVCDPCVPCTIQPPPDPCDEFYVPNFLDPAAVDFNPSYSFGTTLTTSATSTTSTPVNDQKVIGIARYFRLVVEEEPTIKVTHQVSGSDVFDNLSSYNQWDTNWTLRMIQAGGPTGFTWTTLAPGPVNILRSATRNIRSDCSEDFLEVIERGDPADISAQYTIRPNLIFRLWGTLNETTTNNPPVTTIDRVVTRFNQQISRSLTSCNTVFGFGFTMFCRSVAGGTGSGSCQPFPANGSANVTASVTLDIEY
jgi:hypothetical protein